jgi:hypothetical protein
VTTEMHCQRRLVSRAVRRGSSRRTYSSMGRRLPAWGTRGPSPPPGPPPSVGEGGGGHLLDSPPLLLLDAQIETELPHVEDGGVEDRGQHSPSPPAPWQSSSASSHSPTPQPRPRSSIRWQRASNRRRWSPIQQLRSSIQWL